MQFSGIILSLLISSFTTNVEAKDLRDSVVKLTVRSFSNSSDCYSSEGGAFFLDSLSTLHTAAHVITKCGNSSIARQGPFDYVIEMDIRNDYFSEPLVLHNVKLVEFDLASDHAILDLSAYTYLLPIQLTFLRTATAIPQANDVTYSAGYANHSKSLVVIEGRFKGVVQKEPNLIEFVIDGAMPAGQSGGPTVNKNMDVVGVNRARTANEGLVVNVLN
jgi:hypothetical protein